MPTRTWLPPAYLAWRTGGLPSGLAPKLAGLVGVDRVVVVAGDTAWMMRSARRDGTVVERVRAPFRVPIDAFAARPFALAPFLPLGSRSEVVKALLRGRGVLGSTSAALRHLGVGDRMVFDGNHRIVVGAVVPDDVASWSELLVSRDVGANLRIHDDRFALLQMRTHPTERALSRKIRRIVGPGYPIRVRTPSRTRFRRHADSVWPPVLMKEGFGEFIARPYPGRPGYLQMGGSFVARRIATRTVPLLGRATCNIEVFPPLVAAMRELRRKGLGGLVHNFAGCFNARTVMRLPNAAPSHHAWGGAVDINSIQNPYGSPSHQDPRLVAVMARHGFSWGGTWTVPDAMHFEYEIPGIAPA